MQHQIESSNIFYDSRENLVIELFWLMHIDWYREPPSRPLDSLNKMHMSNQCDHVLSRHVDVTSTADFFSLIFLIGFLPICTALLWHNYFNNQMSGFSRFSRWVATCEEILSTVVDRFRMASLRWGTEQDGMQHSVNDIPRLLEHLSLEQTIFGIFYSVIHIDLTCIRHILYFHFFTV